MTDRLLTIIPAKGTSRRVPNKNLADLGGKPLVLWTIEAALGVDFSPHYVVVSSESRAVLEVANSHGAHPLHRPPELCADPAQMPEVALHALQACGGFDPTIVCVLLPTSPFRTREHIEEGLRLHVENDRRAVVSVTTDGMGHKAVTVNGGGYINDGPKLRDPHMMDIALLTGGIWIESPERLRRVGFIDAVNGMPLFLTGPAALDIDTPADLEAARMAL